MGNGGNHHRILFFPGNLPLRRLLEGVGGPRPSDMLFSAGFHRGQNQRKRREKKEKKKWNGYQNDMAELDAFPKDHQHNRDEESYYGRHGGKGPDSFGIPDIGHFPAAGAPVFSILMNAPGLQVRHSLFAVGAKRQLIFHIPSSLSRSSVPFQVPIRLVSVVFK